MNTNKKIIAFYLLSTLFLLANAFAIVKLQTYLFNLVPVAAIILACLFFAFDKVLLFSVFLIPFSVPLKEFVPGLDFNIDLPTEPLFVLFLIIFIFKQLKDNDLDKDIVKHPISLAIYFYLIWEAITIFTSTMPIVSIKHFLASLWFIVPFFFLASQLFKNEKNINTFFWLYIISFSIIITITLVEHSETNFIQKTANWVMRPFYNDHTSYGAALAMYIPFLIGFVFNKTIKKTYRIIAVVFLAYFILALILSYTRAAWASLVGSLIVFIVLKFKINYKFIITAAVALFIMFFAFQDKLFFTLGDNKQDSSTDFAEHVKSMTNVATDASNLERINRWNCAVRMFKEKPIFGWGAGTYQFQYAPFQSSYEKTIISTNAGDMGNAHSEYLGALAETGIFGLVSLLLVAIAIFATAAKTYMRSTNYNHKIIILSTIAGLVSYLLHGFLNNFLDIDKIAVPFWGFAAIIAAISIYTNKQQKI